MAARPQEGVKAALTPAAPLPTVLCHSTAAQGPRKATSCGGTAGSGSSSPQAERVQGPCASCPQAREEQVVLGR